MKLLIQIPAYNESQTLPQTIAALPRQIPRVDVIEILVIDDGSQDNTSDVAVTCGADHILRLPINQGLARAFLAGTQRCLELGADIIVNTDADNQYSGKDVARLIQPILDRQAEIVIGARTIDNIAQFSWLKKRLQKLGSWAVSLASGIDIPDAPSGFRAFSRSAALRLNVFNRYTYTLETIIQAGSMGIPLVTIPIRVNRVDRPSRLMSSAFDYVRRSTMTIIRVFITYRAVRFFVWPGLISVLIGTVIGSRFLYHYIFHSGRGMVQSLVLAATLVLLGFGSIVVGLVTDLISVNRKLLESVEFRVRQLQLDYAAVQKRIPPPNSEYTGRTSVSDESATSLPI